jgi:hypothetical protein
MLNIYTFPKKSPKHCIDLSGIPLDELVGAALAVYAHQRNVEVWFGYLDGWMLTPQEETQLRKVVRAFPCGVVSCFPVSFSHAWKNEINTIYTAQVNGDSNSDNNGCSVHNGSTFGHEQARPRTSS